MTRAEEGLLLLSCPLGDAQARVLSAARFHALAAAVARADGQGDAMRELTKDDLQTLGCAPQEAEQIVWLLSREAQLRRYLAAAERRGFFVLTRLSPDYPHSLRKKLGAHAPAALFCAGDRATLRAPAVGLVGSRALGAPGRQFARTVGTLAAREGFALVSGGAAGADTCAQEACLAAGGQVVCYLADALSARTNEPLPPGLLLVAEAGWDIPFSAPRALARNRLIHASGERTLVAQTDCGHGGTWSGTTENLRHGWSEVYVCDDGSPGAQALCERGASAIAPDALTSLRALVPNQLRFF